MAEEDLRTHFLVQLNAQYEGRASAETFNFQGKTDILIRAEGQDVFVAECKFGEAKSNFSKPLTNSFYISVGATQKLQS